MKRYSLTLASALCVLLLLHCSQTVVVAKDTWTSVHSKNFLLVGNASEKEIRKVAIRLEQFRDVFSRLFRGMRISSPVPTTVVVFKSESSYRPFKPLYQAKPAHISGYFQSGADVNYITLTTEQLGDDPFNIILHEYVHLLLHNSIGRVPSWFNEGLAEYYSTFDLTEDDRKVLLGKLIPSHVLLLQRERMLPLHTLFAVDEKSTYYNERDKQSIFYAESWALVHYLILGNSQKREQQLDKFVELLQAGAAPERAFQQAFQADYETIEKELSVYVQGRTLPQQITIFRQKLLFDTNIQSAVLTDAEALAYLGDLLLHTQRLADADATLQQALTLDPNLAMAHASLGMVRVRQKRFGEAIEHLKEAVTADPKNYLAHYYYAFALSRIDMNEVQLVTTYEPETAATIRSELSKSIELRPSFPESYHLLAFVNLVRDEQIDESIALVRQALLLSPGRDDFVFVLAQLYMRKQDFGAARQILQPMLRESAEAQSREQARILLNSMKAIEAQMARLQDAAQPGQAHGERGQQAEPLDAALQLEPALRKLGEGEQRLLGVLQRIDCVPGTIVFAINADGEIFRLHSNKLEQVQFITYTTEVGGEITCGVRNPPSTVVATYRPRRGSRERIAGEIVALEFVPPDFKLSGKQ